MTPSIMNRRNPMTTCSVFSTSKTQMHFSIVFFIYKKACVTTAKKDKLIFCITIHSVYFDHSIQNSLKLLLLFSEYYSSLEACNPYRRCSAGGKRELPHILVVERKTPPMHQQTPTYLKVWHWIGWKTT